MTTNVLCLRPELDFIRVGVQPPASLTICYRAPDDPALPAAMRDADALVIPAVGPKLPSSLFQGTRLKLVQVTGAGVDRLDKAAVIAAGIPVANVPGGSNGALAEYAVTSASLLLRRLSWSSDEIRRGNYGSFRARLLADNVGGLDGLLVGIVGLGMIGLAVAEAFHHAGARIAYFDPAARDVDAARALGAEQMSLDALLGKADVVSLHVPLLAETRNMISAPQLARMKPGAILLHASRGGVVDETALADALSSGHLGGAAIDVYTSEPPTPDNPLLLLKGEAAQRTLLTPHIAGVTRQSAVFLFQTAWQNVERSLRDSKPPLYRVY